MSTILEQTISPRSGDYTLDPALGFELMKSSGKNLEIEKISSKGDIFEAQMKEAKELNQVHLLTELKTEYAKITALKSIAEKGYDKYFMGSAIEEFVKKTKACYITNLQSFSRPIYKIGEKELLSVDTEEYKQSLKREEASNKIKNALKEGIFTNIVIVNLDYPRYEQEEKIRQIRQMQEEEERRKRALEKDPIAFGVHKDIPDVFFFIADWIDEHCDLTLEKIINQL